MNSLIQHTLEHINMINRRWRTEKLNQRTHAHLIIISNSLKPFSLTAERGLHHTQGYVSFEPRMRNLYVSEKHNGRWPKTSCKKARCSGGGYSEIQYVLIVQDLGWGVGLAISSLAHVAGRTGHHCAWVHYCAVCTLCWIVEEAASSAGSESTGGQASPAATSTQMTSTLKLTLYMAWPLRIVV